MQVVDNANKNPLLGLGLYSIPEAARYLRVPSQKVRRWCLGYQFTTRSGERLRAKGFLSGDLLYMDREPVITFADMIHLKFVDLFRAEGVSMPVIREVAKRAADLFENRRPFVVSRLRTDGVTIFAEANVESISRSISEDPESTGEVERIAQDLKTGQMVVQSIAQVFYRDLDYDDELASRWYPLGREGRVVLDPNRDFGKPIDNASGIPLNPLYRSVRAGDSIDKVADWYDVEREAVLAAIQFETQFLRSSSVQSSA